MNELTLEWIQKAERNYAAIKLHQQTEAPDFDTICFHAQQCIEKYLKAWLQETNIRFSKTHDLKGLLDLIVPIIPSWHAWQSDFRIIAPYSVEFRYPWKVSNCQECPACSTYLHQGASSSSIGTQTSSKRIRKVGLRDDNYRKNSKYPCS